MSVDFFVAGRWRNSEAIHGVLHELDRAGFSNYCFVRNDYSGELAVLGSTGQPEELVIKTEAAAIDDPGVVSIFNQDMDVQRSARRFLLVFPAGLASHIEAGVSYGLGKPCYAVGPIEKTETLYRIFDGIFPDLASFANWLESGAAKSG